MARPRKQVRSARERWAREKRYTRVMNRLSACVARSLCEPHFARFQSFGEGVGDFCGLVSEAEPIVENEVSDFFPESPLRITQEILQRFKLWLKSDMGEPVRSLCKPWYLYIRQAHLTCDICRGEAAFVVDSGSEIGDDDVETDEE
ncbi:hypothetical protein FRX31_008287 [Thalictrum thalictroides]|uniref:Uncharacterized protein n=1 Tax=Thalictrum thalictroides TaxID=46969 RepID=A0A7J6WXD3_THATH|nr:hypothetical protein FRX31_008287 [Thalictrum thalictroides]